MKLFASVALVVSFVCSVAQAAGLDTIKRDGFFGCQSTDVMDKLMSMIIHNDKEALTKLLTAGVLTGQCTIFRPGDGVYVEDTKIFSGLFCLRRRGGVPCFWAPLEALK